MLTFSCSLLAGVGGCFGGCFLRENLEVRGRGRHLGFFRKKSRTSRDRPDGTTHTGASLETHN